VYNGHTVSIVNRRDRMDKAVRIGKLTDTELELINILSPDERKIALLEAAKKKVERLMEGKECK